MNCQYIGFPPVPRKVLKDRYETGAEADEPQQTDLDLDQDELYDEDQFYKESEAIPPAPKLQGANVGRSFDFDTNSVGEEATSTLLPPLLSRNDGSLEGKCWGVVGSYRNWQRLQGLVPRANYKSII